LPQTARLTYQFYEAYFIYWDY